MRLRKLYEAYYRLEGRTIKTTGLTEDGFPFLVLDDGTRIEVSRDAEGNGPGFLGGLPCPKDGGK